jgi:hypothetical protein
METLVGKTTLHCGTDTKVQLLQNNDESPKHDDKVSIKVGEVLYYKSLSLKFHFYCKVLPLFIVRIQFHV